MPWVHKPRSGSLGYWPRKRAKRIYPSIENWPDSKDAKPLAFAGYKAGMLTAILKDNRKGSVTLGQNVAKAVTIIDCPPIFVIGARGYNDDPVTTIFCSEDKVPKDLKGRVSIGKKGFESLKHDKVKEIRLVCSTQPRDSGIGKKEPEIFEIPLGGDIGKQFTYAQEKLGKEITIKDIFKEGEYVDAIAVTKGKGFTGSVKRFGVKILTRKKKRGHRKVGAIGSEGIGRLLFSVNFPGQHGYHRRTEFNKAIVKIGNEEKVNPKGGFVNYGEVNSDYCIIDGSLPGSKRRLVVLRAPIRTRQQYRYEFKGVELLTQQA